MTKEDAESKIQLLEIEEQTSIQKLREAEKEREELDEELRALELQEQALDEEEAELVEFWSMV